MMLIALAACSGDVVTVFAASSLTDAFTEMEAAYEADHDVDVRMVFAGSQVLRLQIEQGARADVFATADVRQLGALTGRVREDYELAANELVAIVPEGSPLQRFEQLASAERIVVGTPGSPIGTYTAALLDADPAFAAAVRNRVVSEESNTRLVRAKVELGEADAAIVYATDVREGLRALVPKRVTKVRYRIATLDDDGDAFVDWVRGDAGTAILRRHGFR